MTGDSRHRDSATRPAGVARGQLAAALILAALLSGCHIDWSQQAPPEVNRENHRGYGP